MFQHNAGQLTKPKGMISGRFTLFPDIFFVDPANSVLSTDSTVVARLPNPGIGLIVLLLVAMLLFVFLTIIGVSVLGSEAQLDRSDVTVQGIVINHRRNAAGSVNQGVLHYVTYLYSVPGQGETLTKEQYVTEMTYSQLEDGDPVLVKYLQSDPSIAELSGPASTNSLALNGYFMTVFGLIGGLVALVFLVSHVWQYYRDDVLIRKGRLLMGEVLKCRADLNVTQTSLESNNYGNPLRGHHFIELTYIFNTPEGNDIEATVKARRNDLVGQLLPEFGTSVAVLYLNDRCYKIL